MSRWLHRSTSRGKPNNGSIHGWWPEVVSTVFDRWFLVITNQYVVFVASAQTKFRWDLIWLFLPKSMEQMVTNRRQSAGGLWRNIWRLIFPVRYFGNHSVAHMLSPSLASWYNFERSCSCCLRGHRWRNSRAWTVRQDSNQQYFVSGSVGWFCVYKVHSTETSIFIVLL